MKKEIKILAVPEALPQDAKDFTFSKDWTEAEGVAMPDKWVPTTSDKVTKDDFILNFEIVGQSATWTMLASQYQARCRAAKVEPYVKRGNELVVNPNIYLTFRKDSKGRVQMSVKPLTDADLQKLLK